MDRANGGFDVTKFAQKFNQFSPEYGPHFKEIYSHMRSHCPVAHTDAGGGFWAVTRYADIVRVDADEQGFSSLYAVFPGPNRDTPRSQYGSLGEARTGPLAACPLGPKGEAPRLSLLPFELDPPQHIQYRKALEPLFSPHAVTELAPWLLALSDQLIDAIIETGEGDFSRDLSTPLVGLFTMKFLGLPLADWSDYAWFIQSATGGTGSVQPRTEKLSERELGERVTAEVVRQRTQPVAGGAIAHLLDAAVDGRKLENWEIEALIWPIIGNMAATQACLASSFVWLSRNPEQRRRLSETPQLMPHAIEEFLRVFTPVHALGRTVMHDVELAGQSLKPGDRVILSWASANLDETEFENPEEVDFDRANKRHLAFGLGGHRCMAPDVVRLEFQTLFGQILTRLPDFRIEQEGLRPTGAPGVVAGYEHVPFVFTPGKKTGRPRIVY